MFVSAAGRRRAASAVARQRSRRLRNLLRALPPNHNPALVVHRPFTPISALSAGSSRCVRRPIVTRTNVRADSRRKRRRSRIYAQVCRPRAIPMLLWGTQVRRVGGTCYQPDRANCRPQGRIPLPCRGDAAASMGEEPPGLRAAHPGRQDREPRGVDQLPARIPGARNPGVVHLSAERRAGPQSDRRHWSKRDRAAGARRPAGAGGDCGRAASASSISFALAATRQQPRHASSW